MLSRRVFSSCALCAGMQLVALGARAQGAPGFSRTVLNKTELTGTGYECVQVIVSVDPGALVARHTHPGVESTIVMEGGGTIAVHGMADRIVKASEGFEVPPETPHSFLGGAQPTRLAATFTVERGKPLSAPALE